MTNKFSDLLAALLFESKFRIAFAVTGGAVVHLIHSCGKAGMKLVYAHHEQGAAYMAEGYARISKNRACCLVTTGPGGTNAITGLASSWTDSIPVLFISGQVRTPFLTFPGSVRQIGSQHLDIVTIVRSLTKEAVVLQGEVQNCLEKVKGLVDLTLLERPGPVWIDIPLDLQEETLTSDIKTPLPTSNGNTSIEGDTTRLALDAILTSISRAKRPVIVLGFGAHLSDTASAIVEFATKFKIPIVLTWNTLDSVPTYNKNNLGLIGVNGNRSANLIIFKSDLVIAFGSHLSRQLTGNNIDDFAPNAEVLVLDIDDLEIKNLPDRFMGFRVNLNYLVPKLAETLKSAPDYLLNQFSDWEVLYSEIKSINTFDQFTNPDKSAVCQYEFYREFNSFTENYDIVVIDGGGNTLFSTHQNLQIKEGMRVFTGHGMGAMGSGVPHAIGASFALLERNTQDVNRRNKVYCFIGDGSLQFNIQELSVVSYHKLPIVIFVINNGGYLAIKNTEDKFFGERFGVDKESGLVLPNYEELASAYGIKYLKLNNSVKARDVIFEAKQSSSPVMVEVLVHEDTPLVPRLDFNPDELGIMQKDKIYDMTPKLPKSVWEEILDA